MEFSFWYGFMGGLGIGLIGGVLSPITWGFIHGMRIVFRDYEHRPIIQKVCKLPRREALTLKRALRKVDRKRCDDTVEFIAQREDYHFG